MSAATLNPHGLDSHTVAFYQRAIGVLQEADIPFLVGGAYALACYAGITRHTKDFDIFVLPRDCRRVLETLAAAGYDTELTFPHWLGKGYQGDTFIDVIFSSGNGVATVDDEWFTHAVDAEVFEAAVRLCPAEEMIWSKSFVVERERYDGADINHLLHACAPSLDWRRMLRRFNSNWRVLLSHLILFGFVYPAERAKVPAWVLTELLNRLQNEIATSAPDEHLCRGTLLSREQYLVDIGRWGYEDARLQPRGPMNARDIAHWTAAIHTDK